jgi:hypothetical protein
MQFYFLQFFLSMQIELGPLEFLTGICGTMGPFNEAPDRDVVTSLTLITNARRRGPFGRGGGSPFQIPMRGNGSIVGFFGCADSFVHAIGVYANPHLQEAPAPQVQMTERIGPDDPTQGTGFGSV